MSAFGYSDENEAGRLFIVPLRRTTTFGSCFLIKMVHEKYPTSSKWIDGETKMKSSVEKKRNFEGERIEWEARCPSGM